MSSGSLYEMEAMPNVGGRTSTSSARSANNLPPTENNPEASPQVEEMLPTMHEETIPDDSIADRIPRPKKAASGQVESDAEMYEKLLEPLLAADKMRCDAWKEEVQNLLIFAGLFSAIVTAFIIESYKGLQPDPSDATLAVLLRIADRLDSPLNATTSATSQVGSFSPTHSVIRVNILWFLSLILSLTTVLVGIISLQWLREHQQYNIQKSSKTNFAIFNHRSESLTRWYVPQIFAALPVALQFALVLFFAGITDFLLTLSREVAIPVVIAIALPIIFVVATTTLPTFQAFTLRFPFLLQVNDAVPVPFPFKSPQSHIFRRLSTFSDRFFFLAACTFVPFYMLVLLPRHAYQFIKSIFSHSASKNIQTWAPFHARASYTWKGISFSLDILYNFWCNETNWTDTDALWPQIRTQYASLLHECRDIHWKIDRHSVYLGVCDFATSATTVYDCVHGFREIMKQTMDSNQIHRVFHCANNFSLCYLQATLTSSGETLFSSKIAACKSYDLEILLRCEDNLYNDSIAPHPPFLIGTSGSFMTKSTLSTFHVLHQRAILENLLSETNESSIRIPFLRARAECYLKLVFQYPDRLFSIMSDALPFVSRFKLRPELSSQLTAILHKHLRHMPKQELQKQSLKAIFALQQPEDVDATMELLNEELRRLESETASVAASCVTAAFVASEYFDVSVNWSTRYEQPSPDPPKLAVDLLDTLLNYSGRLYAYAAGQNIAIRKTQAELNKEITYVAWLFQKAHPSYHPETDYRQLCFDAKDWLEEIEKETSALAAVNERRQTQAPIGNGSSNV